jgi:AAA domain
MNTNDEGRPEEDDLPERLLRMNDTSSSDANASALGLDRTEIESAFIRRHGDGEQCPDCQPPRCRYDGSGIARLDWERAAHNLAVRGDLDEDTRKRVVDAAVYHWRENKGCLPSNDEWLSAPYKRDECPYITCNGDVEVRALHRGFSDDRYRGRALLADVTVNRGPDSRSSSLNLADAGQRASLARTFPSDQNTVAAALNNCYAQLLEDELGDGASAGLREVELPWTTAPDLVNSLPPETPYILEPFLPVAAHLDIVGDPKIGKSTFVAAVVRAVLEKKPFLDRQPSPAFDVGFAAIWLTEEPAAAFRETLKRTGLDDHFCCHILHLTDMRAAGLSWPQMMLAARKRAEQVCAEIVVVDTFAKWAGLKDEEENQSGPVAVAMQPIEDAVAAGFTVITIRHERKAGGSLIDAGRGSSALAGTADILLRLRHPGGQGHANRRVIEGLGRFVVPEETVIDWVVPEGSVVGHYELVAGTEVGRAQDAVYAVLDSLPDGEDRTIKELAETEPFKEFSESAIRRALTTLEELGTAGSRKRTGRGQADAWFVIHPIHEGNYNFEGIAPAQPKPRKKPGGGAHQ